MGDRRVAYRLYSVDSSTVTKYDVGNPSNTNSPAKVRRVQTSPAVSGVICTSENHLEPFRWCTSIGVFAEIRVQISL